jgi:DNA adenine methylase
MSTAPKYQVMPPMDTQERAALRESIIQNGVLVAIERDEDGNVLDGHNRWDIWSSLIAEGYDIPEPVSIIRTGLSEVQKRAHARALNLARRHVNVCTRRELVREQLLDTPERSNQAIAAILSVDDKTVAYMRRQMEGDGEIAVLSMLIGADGRTRPSRRCVLTRDNAELKRTVRVLESVESSHLPDSMLHVRDVERVARQRNTVRPPAGAGAQLKTVLKYPGSKYKLASIIAEVLPMSAGYLEPCAGSAAVLLARTASGMECINDLSQGVSNFWRVMRLYRETLAHLVEMTPYSRWDYDEADHNDADELAAIERAYPDCRADWLLSALHYVIRSWQGFGSSNQVSTGWSRTLGSGDSRHVHGHLWAELPARIMAVGDRLRGVETENRNVLELLPAYSNPSWSVYLDPTYPMSTRGGRRLYEHEMTDADHTALLELALRHPAPLVISSYPNEVYDQALCGWERIDLPGSTQDGEFRVESLYRNPIAVSITGPAPSTLSQGSPS